MDDSLPRQQYLPPRDGEGHRTPIHSALIRAKKKPGAGAASGRGQGETTLGLLQAGPRLPASRNPLGMPPELLASAGEAIENAREAGESWPGATGLPAGAVTSGLRIGRKLFDHHALFSL